MLQRLLRMLRGVEVGVAIPIGCMVPLAIAAAALVGAGLLIGQTERPMLTTWLCASSTTARWAGRRSFRLRSCHCGDASAIRQSGEHVAPACG
jgi:hypothetical protein